MAKRLIDATEAKEWAEKHILDAKERYAILDFLRECSTVDAVEVVWCKDCSKWMPEFGGCKEFTTERLPTGGKKVFVTKPDDFCSYGERKEG